MRRMLMSLGLYLLSVILVAKAIQQDDWITTALAFAIAGVAFGIFLMESISYRSTYRAPTEGEAVVADDQRCEAVALDTLDAHTRVCVPA